MAFARPNPLPVLPLENDAVLLPGIVIRVPINGRSDIPPLISHVNERSKLDQRAGAGAMTIGCVPMSSPLLNRTGQNLITDSEVAVNDGKLVGDVKKDLFDYGTLAKICGIEGKGTGEMSLLVEGVARFRVERLTQFEPCVQAEVSYYDDDGQGLFAHLKQLSRQLLTLLKLSSLLPRGGGTGLSPLVVRRLESYIAKRDIDQAGLLADFMSNMVDTSHEERLQILAAWDVNSRLEKVIEILSRQVKGIKGNVKITAFTSAQFPAGLDINEFNKNNRDTLSRRGQTDSSQLRGKQGEDGDEEMNELDELKKRLEDAGLTPEAQKVAKRELKRLEKLNPAQAEHQVCRNYLETLSEIPWSRVTEDQLGPATLARARKQLDDDHYGLEKVKKRLLEYLAVLKLKRTVNAELDAQLSRPSVQSPIVTEGAENDAETSQLKLLNRKRMVDKSPILLLVGPPGTGKTSLAQSVATALGRKFHRISLGGVRDEAEIRGHRRTYVAAMPGLIINGLKKVGVANPVFLLDEIDKVGTSNFHGDPSAAMLEVLDPEQNHTFSDHYVNVPVDLSKVLFIATANSLDTIPAPLLDRMETISLPGYTTLEKRHIASQHLIPKQIISNALRPEQVEFTEEALDKVITAYTRESGVRNLEREIGSVCRCKAVQFAEAQDGSQLELYRPQVSVDDLEEILGIEKFDEEIAEKTSRPGIVTGLVAYSSGGNGSILFIEVEDMPGNGRVQLTGKLGDVLKESVEVALTWVKAHSCELGLTHDPSEDIMKNRSVHVHCPSGAIPKDGPSAGLAHTIALISLFSGKAVPPTIAMTGEISLRGRVMPVGGIKEKLIGALRAGVKTVLLPAQNRKDVKDLPQEVKDGLEIIHVSHIWEGMRHVWPEAHWPGEEQLAGIEARL